VPEARVSGEAVAQSAWTEAQRAVVLLEVHRVLDHPAFKSSGRCVALLQCLFARALEGDHDGVKERTLGIEAFGRAPDYDTNTDPIVRRTANEIRKRLAQCYEGPERDYSVRIHLVRGSYVLEFDFAAVKTRTGLPDADGSESGTQPLRLRHQGGANSLMLAGSNRRYWVSGIVAALLIVAGCALLIHSELFRAPEYRVWKPLLGSGDWVLICLSDADSQLASSTGKSGAQAINNIVASPQAPPAPGAQQVPPSIPFIDAHVSHAISMLLLGFNRQTRLQASSALTLQDFRQRPAVLIGGTNNPWALILLSKLRYSIRVDPVSQDKWIQDAQNLSNRDWKIDGALANFSDVPNDYAVVTRVFDSQTGQWVIALSGLEAYGTEAAGELVADPAFGGYIPASLKSSGNFQIVLKTSVVRGSTGPIQVLAVHAW
jgi:hypothetical protein